MLIIVSEGVGGDDCQERGRLIFTLRPRCQPQLAGKDGSHHQGNQPPGLQLSKIIMSRNRSASPEIQLGSWGGEQTLTWFLLPASAALLKTHQEKGQRRIQRYFILY